MVSPWSQLFRCAAFKVGNTAMELVGTIWLSFFKRKKQFCHGLRSGDIHASVLSYPGCHFKCLLALVVLYIARELPPLWITALQTLHVAVLLCGVSSVEYFHTADLLASHSAAQCYPSSWLQTVEWISWTGACLVTLCLIEPHLRSGSPFHSLQPASRLSGRKHLWSHFGRQN